MLQAGGVGKPGGENIHTIVESSSGSTVTSMAVIARQYGVQRVRAWMSNKVSPTKARLMRFFGLELALYGGPSQSPPRDPRGGIAKAANQGSKPGHYNPNQYENTANPAAHERWTSKQLLSQLPGIDMFSAGMGTGGTITGTGQGLKEGRPSVHVIGVCVAPGDKVPGPRPRLLLEPVDFPWRKNVDSMEDVGSSDSYRLSMELCRYGLISGPSSGFTLQGLYQVLGRHKEEGTLDTLRQGSKPIEAVFLCCDLPFQYLDEYFDKLGPESFPPILNEHLFDVDKFSYQEEWELPPPAALALLAGPPWGATNGLNGSAHIAQTNGTSHSSDPSPSPAPVILDLRASSDFSATRLIGSRSTPLSSLRQSDPSPFEDSALLSTQWTELRARFVPPKPESHQAPAAGADVTACRESTGAGAGTCSGSTAALPALVAQLSQSRTPVLIICYEGDTSRVATSVLRHEGVQAYSVHGGLKAWAELGLPVEEVEG